MIDKDRDSKTKEKNQTPDIKKISKETQYIFKKDLNSGASKRIKSLKVSKTHLRSAKNAHLSKYKF